MMGLPTCLELDQDARPLLNSRLQKQSMFTLAPIDHWRRNRGGGRGG